MKKIIYSIMALLAIAGTSKAQNSLSVADITLPQNGEATLTVSFQFDAADTYTGYYFNLELPSELEFVMDEGTDVAYTKGSCHDASHSVTANLDEGLVKVAGLSLGSKPLKGTSGTLLTFTIKPKSTISVGQTFTGTIKDILIVPIEGTKKSLDASNFTITIGEPTDSRINLYETSTTVPSAATGVDVRVKRTIKANEWSTICLPFAMTAAQVKAAFGNDVELGDFSSWSSEEDAGGDITAITVGFTTATAIEANHPYIIKVTSAITEFTVDGVNIDPEAEPTKQVGTKKAERGYFIGTYAANTTVPQETLFLNSNKFWYSTGNTKMKAFRGWFEFADVLTGYEANAPVFITFENETTGIAENEKVRAIENDAFYNLNGQRVMNPKKGLYIKNNKKIIVK